MSIAEGLVANRTAYREYFREAKEAEKIFLPPAPSLLEEEPFVFPTVTAREPEPVYRLESEPAMAPILRQGEAPSPDDDLLLDRLVYRLDRESRLRSQPLLEE